MNNDSNGKKLVKTLLLLLLLLLLMLRHCRHLGLICSAADCLKHASFGQSNISLMQQKRNRNATAAAAAAAAAGAAAVSWRNGWLQTGTCHPYAEIFTCTKHQYQKNKIRLVTAPQ